MSLFPSVSGSDEADCEDGGGDHDGSVDVLVCHRPSSLVQPDVKGLTHADEVTITDL